MDIETIADELADAAEETADGIYRAAPTGLITDAEMRLARGLKYAVFTYRNAKRRRFEDNEEQEEPR